MRVLPATTGFDRGTFIVMLGVLLVWLGGTQGAAGHIDTIHDPERWIEGFRLEPGVTYTYVLSEYDRHGHGRRVDEPGGELNLWRTPGDPDEIRFWYTIDGVQGRGTAPNDPRALAGALLLTALTGPDPLDLDALRLLSTPLQWVHWIDHFLESDFRRGVVWEVYQHPPLRFTARRHGAGTYSGEVTVGRDVVLELRISLFEPLPMAIVSRFGRDAYRAELKDTPGRGPLR